MEVDGQLVDWLQSLGDTLRRLGSGSVPAAQAPALLQEAEDLVFDCDRELNDLQPQIRHLPYQEKVDASKRLETHRLRLRGYQEELERFRGGSAASAAGSGGAVNLAAMSRRDRQAYKQERDRLLVAKGMVDEDDGSLKRSMQSIEETVGVGVQTQVELQEQRESMVRSKAALEESDDFLVRSRNTLRRMRRRLMTNKLLSFVIILVELLIIALIVWLKFFK